MKKFREIISWCSVLIIAIILGCGCIYCGAMVANFLKDYFHITGWWCLALAPVVLFVAIGIELFFILGMKKFGQE